LLKKIEPRTNDIMEKLVWVSHQKTTWIEDLAYCLIGIFDIPLTIMYGEGKKAFHGLQAEIVQHSHDRGLFIWAGSPSSYNSMVAEGPTAFLHNLVESALSEDSVHFIPL